MNRYDEQDQALVEMAGIMSQEKMTVDALERKDRVARERSYQSDKDASCCKLCDDKFTM